MLGVVGDAVIEEGQLRLAFNEGDLWNSGGLGGGTAKGIRGNEVFIGSPGSFFLGDPVSGPVLTVMATPPVPETVLFPTHFHRSDSFRICLRGEIIMTPRHLVEGEFRLLEAGQFYSEGFGPSPRGVWTVLLMGDRRGAAAELAKPDDPAAIANKENMEKLAVAYNQYLPELFDESSRGTPGVGSNLSHIAGSGHVDGSFSEVGGWPLVEGTRISAATLGDRTTGPLVLLIHAKPNSVAMPACRFGTEVARVVVSGSCDEEGVHRIEGDVVVSEAGVAFPECRGGPDGVDQIVVIADRRFHTPEPDRSTGVFDLWRSGLDAIVERLSA